MKFLKMRVLPAILSGMLVFYAVFTSYSMTVQATDVGLTLSTLDAMLSLFGVSIGVGNQVDRLSNNEIMGDVMDAASTGGTVTMSNYGTVDFSDSESVNNWLTWCADHNDYTLGRYEGNNVWDNTVDKVARNLDSVSYAATGLCATNEMNNSITNLVSNLSSDSGYTVEDIHDACTVVSGADNGTLTWDKWNIFSAIASAVVLSNADKMVDIVNAFKVPDETVYKELSSAFSDADGFVPGSSLNNFSYTADPSYSNYSSYKVIVDLGIINNRFIQKIVPASYVEYGACFILNPYMNFYCLNNNQVLESKNYDTFIHIFESDTFYHSVEGFFNQNEFADHGYVSYIPVFSDTKSAYAFFNEGDTSGILNLVDGIAYPDFKTKVQARPTSFDRALEGLIDADPSINKFKDKIPAILDVADTAVGTPEAVSAVEEAIADSAGTGTTDTDGATTNYTGILGKILSVLKSILDAILSIPAAIIGLLADAFVPDLDSWKIELQERCDTLEENVSILTLPLAIITLIMGIFLDTGNIDDFILTIPELEFKGNVIFEGYTFNVTEFVHTDMVVKFYNMYRLITDVMIIFWIANYAARKFTTIIERN